MSFTNEIWLCIRTDIADGLGDGTPSNPYAANTPESFRNIMADLNKVGENSIIRLGPGIFRTRGGGGDGVQVGDEKLWRPRPGQKIVGAGMFATTLQFVWDIPPTGVAGPRHYMIWGVEYLTSFEISDLTLDCNLQHTPFDTSPFLAGGGTASLTSGSNTVTTTAAFFDSSIVDKIIYFYQNEQDPTPDFSFSAKIQSFQSATQATLDRVVAIPGGGTKSNISYWAFGPKFSVTAVSVVGDNVRFRRLRVINFGTRTPLQFDGLEQAAPPSPPRSCEGFPLIIAGRTADTPSFNSWMEDCVIEQPYPSPAREVTYVVQGGVGTWASPPLKLHLEPFGCGMRNCYMNFEFVNPRPGNPVPFDGSSVVYSGADPTDVTVTTRFPHRFYKGDFVEITGGDVAVLNGRFEVKEISGQAWAERTFSFRVSAPQPAQPTGLMHAFFSPLPTMRASLSGSIGSTEVTVSTDTKHKRLFNDWVCIAGATADEYNGTFRVTWVSTDGLSFKYQLASNPATGTPGGEIWLDRRPTGAVQISKVTRRADVNGVAIGEFETHAPHYRKPGEWIIPIMSILTTTQLTNHNSYNNYIKVTGDELGRLKFRCELPGTLNIGAVNDEFPQLFVALSPNYQASYANGGYGGGVHSNRVANANRGCYHDFNWHRQLIARKNYFYNINHGAFFAANAGALFGEPAINAKFIDATIHNIAGGIVTVKLTATNADPGYVPGVVLQVSKTGVEKDVYITEVLPFGSGPFTFKFRDPGGFNASDAVKCKLWAQQGLFLFEDNILELALAPKGWTTVGPIGVVIGGPQRDTLPLPTPPDNPYIFYNGGKGVHGLDDGWIAHEVFVRDNIFRKVGDQEDPDSSTSSSGIRMNSCHHLIVEGNILGRMNNAGFYPLNPYWLPHELDYSNAGFVKSFSNQYPDGKLRQLFNDPGFYGNLEYWLDETETRVEYMVLGLGRTRRRSGVERDV